MRQVRPSVRGKFKIRVIEQGDKWQLDEVFLNINGVRHSGDLLPYSSSDQRGTGNRNRLSKLGPWALVNADKGQLQMDVVDLQIDRIGESLLGLTLAGAHCHDDKFDPIPQKV